MATSIRPLLSLPDSGLTRFHARYLILDVLGQGTFGQVVKCQNIKTHEIVAVKVVKNKPAYFNQSMMEVTLLEMVRASTNRAPISRLTFSIITTFYFCSSTKSMIQTMSTTFYGFGILSFIATTFALSSSSSPPTSTN